MNCLTSAQVQAVVDREAPRAVQEHAEACAVCLERVAGCRRQIATIESLGQSGEMPPGLAARIHTALADPPAVSGATRLRAGGPPRWGHARWGTAALGATTVLAAVFLLPAVKEDRGAVSAAEVLAASASRLAEGVNGVETLEYELVLEGIPGDVMPEQAVGAYRVRQTIDHRVSGRFRYTSSTIGGDIISAIAQDPSSGRRTMLFVLDAQPYRFDLTVPPGVGPALPELERLHTEATIAMMQAAGDSSLEAVETAEGRYYRIESPRIAAQTARSVWDLREARVVVDAEHYRIHELAVKGAFLEQPYSISYRLISRSVTDDVSLDVFEVPEQAGEIRIAGEGSVIPARDAAVLALRELARLKQAR